MKLEFKHFQSKVARRLFMLFVLSALIPVTMLAYLTANNVTNEVIAQSERALYQSSKQIGMAIFENLLNYKKELYRIATKLKLTSQDRDANKEFSDDIYLKRYFDNLTIINGKNERVSLFGNVDIPSTLSKKEKQHLSSGNALLQINNGDKFSSRYYMQVLIDPLDPNSARLVGQLDKKALFNVEQILPPLAEVCIFSNATHALYCTDETTPINILMSKLPIANGRSPKFEWRKNNTDFVSYNWSMFMTSVFLTFEWEVILTKPKSEVYAPLQNFDRLFPWVLTLTILLVFFLSSIQIRKYLVPLDKLQEGTKQLALGNFAVQVSINSGDEFQDLAGSFNNMAARLDKQFKILSIMSEVDRILLSSLNTEYIIETILHHIKTFTNSDSVRLFLCDIDDEGADIQVNTEKDQRHLKDIKSISIGIDQTVALKSHNVYFYEGENNLPNYLGLLKQKGIISYIVFPIFVETRLLALIVMGNTEQTNIDSEDIKYARELVDRAAVILSTANWENKLYKQVNFDELTGLPNRVLLKDHLKQAWQRARRNGRQVAVLMFDIDRFRKINDSLGHAAGDIVLTDLASRILNKLKYVDTVARIGSDEFVVIVSDLQYSESVKLMLDSIINDIKFVANKPFHFGDHEIHITLSIGLAKYPRDASECDDLLKYAEVAMYQAKALGGGSSQAYEKNLKEETDNQLALEVDLRYALEHDELELYYQPQFESKTGRLHGAEALIRWNHPKLGLLLPGAFLPIAIESGLIYTLEHWVIDNACKNIRAWLDSGFVLNPLAINLTALQFRNQDLPDIIKNTLDKYRLDAKYLELELTEDLLMEDLDISTKVLHSLRDLGIQLAIDDFGTGYSSLSYLVKFPINYLKIDQMFIRDVPRDANVAAIVSAIIAVAHNLNLKVVAEGVETNEQLQFLNQLDCDIVQGYLFHRAMQADEYTKLLPTEKVSFAFGG